MNRPCFAAGFAVILVVVAYLFSAMLGGLYVARAMTHTMDFDHCASMVQHETICSLSNTTTADRVLRALVPTIFFLLTVVFLDAVAGRGIWAIPTSHILSSGRRFVVWRLFYQELFGRGILNSKYY